MNINASGSYDISARVSNGGSGGTIHVSIDGADVTGAMTFANTGSWDTFRDIIKANVSLTTGMHVLRITCDAGGLDCNALNVIATPVWNVPTFSAVLQAEHFDQGGEGIAYHDVDAENHGGGYRTSGVDIRACVDAGAGWQVGWLNPGEWMQYTVDVTSPGTYDLDVRVASGYSGGTMHISIDGVDVTGAMSVGNTGGWDSWLTVTRRGVPISAGRRVIRFTLDSGALDLNWIQVSPAMPSGLG
ncbi:MAG: carbohydrate-binding protein [Planctomycetes bacterium]|nr:carbohydrate-binding protein [Planctomycetota bacterium]